MTEVGMDHQASASATVKMTNDATAKVIRGEKSWSYIYITLGFSLSIEGTTIQMITPLLWPWNVLVYLCAMVATACLFLLSGRFQNWLVRLRGRYEDKAR